LTGLVDIWGITIGKIMPNRLKPFRTVGKWPKRGAMLTLALNFPRLYWRAAKKGQ